MNFKWEFHDLDKKKINIFYVLFKNIFKSKYIPQYMYANCFEKKIDYILEPNHEVNNFLKFHYLVNFLQ